MSEWPLGFMTKRCKDDFELRKLGQIEESDHFTDGELDVSGRLFKWVSEIDDKVRKEIDKEKMDIGGKSFKIETRSSIVLPSFGHPFKIRVWQINSVWKNTCRID